VTCDWDEEFKSRKNDVEVMWTKFKDKLAEELCTFVPLIKPFNGNGKLSRLLNENIQAPLNKVKKFIEKIH